MVPRRILHCDMDCFYAAVHIRDDPSLQGKPVLIGGDPSGRGVVAAASYEARRFGVHSAMPAAQAKRLCPEAIFLRAEFSRYRQESERIFAIYRSFTPAVQTLSLDEAYLDVTNHLGDFPSATALAQEIRRRVLEECALTVSVGVGPNKLVAKIASDFDKPDGLTVIPPKKVQAFLDPLPVRRLQGVGPATGAKLKELGVELIADLRAIDLEVLVQRFGRHGKGLHDFAHGLDSRRVQAHRQRKSLGAENTFRNDLAHLSAMEAEINRLADQVAQGLERRDLTAYTVTLKVRYPDFTTLSRSMTLAVSTRDSEVLAAASRLLLRRTEAAQRRVRLLGVSVSKLEKGGPIQLSLFPLLGI
ncbi:MAG: DNA polymerase IV [Deltaproteobacteria bacterium]|nr:DNA polymerase IV [Deltaproteobacteria bacterium]